MLLVNCGILLNIYFFLEIVLLLMRLGGRIFQLLVNFNFRGGRCLYWEKFGVLFFFVYKFCLWVFGFDRVLIVNAMVFEFRFFFDQGRVFVFYQGEKMVLFLGFLRILFDRFVFQEMIFFCLVNRDGLGAYFGLVIRCLCFILRKTGRYCFLGYRRMVVFYGLQIFQRVCR